MSDVRIIPSKQKEVTQKRMAAYCRVSTSSEEQLHSYAAQVKYYTDMLTADQNCELVGVYADEGITGTSARKRHSFMEMIEDCRVGKIDGIITKSVSRFGRNTVDTLSYTRELKDLGIDVYFEKENIHSTSPDGELILTLMAAFAEAEAESLSENVAWGFRKKYSEGSLKSLVMCNLYGLCKNDLGEIVIREDEAAVVRRIYDDFLSGICTGQIAAKLAAEGIPTHNDGAQWHRKTVINILQNEKYCGDVLFQKQYSPGALSRCRRNRGELPQYYMMDAIPAIIDRNTWKATQLEYERRVRQDYKPPSPKNPFTGKIYCGVCGRNVVKSSFNSGGAYRTWWRCGTKISRMKRPDDVQHEDIRIPESRPERVFIQAWNLLISKRLQYEQRLKRAADSGENELIRYRASEMLRLMDEKGRLKEFDYRLCLRVLDRMELQPGGKLTVVFLSGVRMTL